MTKKRVVRRVKDLDTSTVHAWDELLGLSDASDNVLRKIAKERATTSNPKYICDSCGQKVYVRSSGYSVDDESRTHNYHFAHYSKKIPCVWQDKKSVSKKQVLIQAYNRKKESDKHIKAKEYICDWLEKDARFSGTVPEKVKKGDGYGLEWRKPDVTTHFYGMETFFEVQVSPTFDEIIFARESFYTRNRAPLFWIFIDFDPEKARQMEKDVFYGNMGNAFSIDCASEQATEERGRLTLTLHWVTHRVDKYNNCCEEYWESELVDFEDLMFNMITYRPFRYDSEYLRDTAFNVLKAHKRKVERDSILSAFEREVKSHEHIQPDSESVIKFINYFDIDENVFFDSKLRTRILCMLCARDGVVYFRKNLSEYKWLTNFVIRDHSSQWSAFLDIARAYGNEAKYAQKDNRKLIEFRRNHQDSHARKEIAYPQDHSLYPIYAALAEEAVYVRRYSNKM